MSFSGKSSKKHPADSKTPKGAVPVDPSPKDWEERALFWLQRGREWKTLLCFEYLLEQEPDQPGVQAMVRNIRETLYGPSRRMYERKKQEIAKSVKPDHGDQTYIVVYNMPHFLGIEPVDLDLYKKLFNF